MPARVARSCSVMCSRDSIFCRIGGGGGGQGGGVDGWVGSRHCCEPIPGHFRIPAPFHFGTFVGPIRWLIQMFGILVFKLIRKQIRNAPPHPALARPLPLPFLLSTKETRWLHLQTGFGISTIFLCYWPYLSSLIPFSTSTSPTLSQTHPPKHPISPQPRPPSWSSFIIFQQARE